MKLYIIIIGLLNISGLIIVLICYGKEWMRTESNTIKHIRGKQKFVKILVNMMGVNGQISHQ